MYPIVRHVMLSKTIKFNTINIEGQVKRDRSWLASIWDKILMMYLISMLLKGPQNPARMETKTKTKAINLYGLRKCRIKENKVLGRG